MFEVTIFPLYGAAVGFHYSNDEMEQVQTSDDKAHIVQLYLLFICLNVVWFTERTD